MTDVDASTWEPGDPLHRNPNISHQSGIFSMRVDSFDSWSDAARWPVPNSRRLPPGDELGDLIEWHRRRRERLVSLQTRWIERYREGGTP